MTSTRQDANSEARIYDSYIVGAGISGLAAAIKLKEEKLDNFKIIEKASRVGGTWRENTYPGCGCDVPSALYSYSFAPSSRWSRIFAKQPEILDYLEQTSRDFGIESLISFDTSLENARWDEARHLWVLKTSKSEDLAKTVIFATGPITEPQTPKISGLNTFEGEMFHSARWNHDFDLSEKRVAVIGTGASAIQFVPEIQPKAKDLFIFQRTAPWVLPKPDFPLGKAGKKVMERLPVIHQRWRQTVAGALNVINVGLRNPVALKPVSQAAKQLIRLQVKDKSLRAAVTPNFTLGCKRILFANNYYPALQARNTHLIPHGLVGVEGNTLIAADGSRREVDVIIWGTGFDVSHPPIGSKVTNTKGQRLSDLWKDSSPEAYLGTAIEEVPNAFLVLGPNVLVYDSFFRLAEAQVGYIVDGLKKIQAQQISKLCIKSSVISAHNQQVQKHLQGTVFNSGGCKSYYLDQNGRNFAAWPWSLAELQRRLKRFRIEEYDVEHVADLVRAAA